MFLRERDIVRWYTIIPQDPGGIPSCAQGVDFRSIHRWRDPTVLGRVLKCFSRVKTLTVSLSRVPSDEVDKIVLIIRRVREGTHLPHPDYPLLHVVDVDAVGPLVPKSEEIDYLFRNDGRTSGFNPPRQDLAEGTFTVIGVLLVLGQGGRAHRAIWNHVP